MDDQRDTRPADHTPRTGTEEAAPGESTAETVARMLANPRRVRRS